ncbi:MAG TPA: SH3 domain-containing protein [Candidatus Limnocylindrales bacterium]
MSRFVPRPAHVNDRVRGRPLAKPSLLLLAACLAIALAAVGAVRPAPALALTTLATRCDVPLRSRPSTSSTRVATLSKATKVAAVKKVSGGRWRSTCAGNTKAGSSWYKITVVKGKSVRGRYGVDAVYVASSLLRKLDSNSNSNSNRTVRVNSISALLRKLADNSVRKIVVANGTYRISPSGHEAGNSLWIGGDRYARRTRPITVRAETIGGVTFDGGGLGAFGGLSFEDGAHHQTWNGFRFTNMKAQYTGIIEVGGYAPRRPPHHITLRNLTITASCTGRATTADGRTWDHGVYLAQAKGVGPHDIRIVNLKVDGRGNLASAVHWDHGDATNPAAWNVTVRNLKVTNTQQAIILWSSGLRNIVFDGADIRGAKAYGVRFESSGASGIVFRNITTRNSGYKGFYSTMGSRPPGVTLSGNSFH